MFYSFPLSTYSEVKGKARERPESEVAQVAGTQTFHQVKKDALYSVACRDLSCFCTACKEGKENCANSEHVSDFKVKKLKPQ